MAQESGIVRIGTRGSELALWQARDLQSKLDQNGWSSELVVIKTKGDRIQDLSFDKIEGKGFFTTEIENALREKEVDVAVHSMKDLPTTGSEGLLIAGISEREDPGDVLLINKDAYEEGSPFSLKKGAKVGTSSFRRKCWLRHFRPDLELLDLRGNVPTRVRRLEEGDYDAIVLAAAGLNRLDTDVSNLKSKPLHPREFVPAPAQGTIAYQIRESDESLRRLLYGVSDKVLVNSIQVERKVLKLLDGGCHSPIGVYCERDRNGFMHVRAGYAEKWTDNPVFVTHSSGTTHELAENIVQLLKDQI